MKKILSLLFTAVVVFAVASCQNDRLNVVDGGSVQVTMSLGVNDGLATRAGDSAADKLVYAVYDANGQLVSEMAAIENAFQGGAQNVSLTLAKGETYTVAFWAQTSSCDAYTVVAGENGMTVEVDYNGLNNDESRDAFFAAETFTVEETVAIDVVLRRPFAKVNMGVTAEDWNAAKATGVNVVESKAVISNAATTLNVNDGTVAGDVTVSYGYAAIPAVATKAAPEAQDFIVNGKPYKLLSSSYVLAGENKSISDGIQFSLITDAGKEIEVSEGLNNVPLQRNFSTNVLGTALTGAVDFTVTNNTEEYASTEVPVGDVEAFKAALADPNVGEIVLPYGIYEGIFIHNKGYKVIKSADPANKAVIKGKVGVSANIAFENIKFDVHDTYSVTNTGHQYLDRFERKSIVPIYAAKATFTGCDFINLYDERSVVAINYGAHRKGVVLEIDNCSFQGYAYTIYSRALISVTNCTFDQTHTTVNPRAIFMYGLGDGSNGNVVFKNNKAVGKTSYAIQLSSSNYNYKNIHFDVQDNENFEVEGEAFLAHPDRDFTGCTFAEGSKTFAF